MEGIDNSREVEILSREVEMLRRQIYDGNLYNSQLNNIIEEEKNVSELKTAGRPGIDLALLVNNCSQLYYLYRTNGEVWPGTWLAWLLVVSIVFQVLALCLLVIDTCYGCYQRGDPEKYRRISNGINCGLMWIIAVLNFVINAIGWDGPISHHPSVHCSSNFTKTIP